MISISDLLTPITTDQQVEVFLTALETAGVPARSWRPGGVYRTILKVVAATYAVATTMIVRFVSAGFLETAAGDWLTWVAYYVYGVERPAASFATGGLTVTNSGGQLFDPITAGQLRVRNPATGKVYTNRADFTCNPGDVVTITIDAVEIGAASSTSAGTITELVTTFAGLTITNALPVVGSDAATDEETRQLCRDKRGISSVRGPRSAYSYAVRSAKRLDGTNVNINRLWQSSSSSTGVVKIRLASPSGVPASDDVTAVGLAIEKLARPGCATVDLAAATAHTVTRSLTVWAQAIDGVSASDIQALVQAALVTINASYPISGLKKDLGGGYLFASTIDGTVKAAHSSIFAVDGCGADEALAEGEVAVLAITVAVRLKEASS